MNILVAFSKSWIFKCSLISSKLNLQVILAHHEDDDQFDYKISLQDIRTPFTEKAPIFTNTMIATMSVSVFCIIVGIISHRHRRRLKRVLTRHSKKSSGGSEKQALDSKTWYM